MSKIRPVSRYEHNKMWLEWAKRNLKIKVKK